RPENSSRMRLTYPPGVNWAPQNGNARLTMDFNADVNVPDPLPAVNIDVHVDVTLVAIPVSTIQSSRTTSVQPRGYAKLVDVFAAVIPTLGQTSLFRESPIQWYLPAFIQAIATEARSATGRP